MTFQSTIRNWRLQGFNVKHAFQLGFLVFCIWLLYQIKHSNFNRKGNYISLQNKPGEEHGAINLGRKGYAGWSSSGDEIALEDTDFEGEDEKKEDRDVGDDDLDRNAEEKAEEASFNKEIGYGHGNAASYGKKEDDKEQEGQYQDPQSNEENDLNIEVEGVESESLIKVMYKKENFNEGHESAKEILPDHDEEGDDEKDPETQVKEPQNSEKNHTSTSIHDRDQPVKANDKNKVPTKIEEKIAEQPGEMVNATLPNQSDLEDGALVFLDENGVSLDAR